MVRPYRIVMVAPTGFFADYGCHVRIRGHARTLQQRGHSVCIVTYPGGRDVDGLPTRRPGGWPRGREMPVGSAWRKLLLDALLAPLVWDAVRRFRPDVLHVYLHEGVCLGWLPARLHRLPLVFDFQGSLVSEMRDHRFLPPRSPFGAPLGRLERWLNHRPAAILPSSQRAANLLHNRFGVPTDRVHVLPDSVAVDAFRPRARHDAAALGAWRRRLDLPDGRPLVVYLGLLAPYQGTDTLLQALAQLPTPRPLLLLMGFPHVARYRQMAAALGIADDVRFTGGVAYEDAPRLLALGDVAVAPKQSDTEGSGKLLPYMATGLPVIASDTPVHREYLADAGLYVPAGDAAALAAAIARACADLPALATQGQWLRARAEACYTWDSAATRIETVYQTVCPTPPTVL